MAPLAATLSRSRLARLPGIAPLLELAEERGGIYLVGGAVRDLLLGRPPLDLDLVVEGELDELLARVDAPVAAHDRFGTARVRWGGVVYDVARARTERYPRPGALPEVAPAGIEEDLRRRDFTVNALAVALAGPRAGRILSPPGALADLEQGVLRILHPLSFLDDPTRMLRLVRYGARLDFAAEPLTEAAATAALGAGALWTAGGARIGAELRLLAREDTALEALGLARSLGLDEAIHPGFGIQDPGLAERARALLPPDGAPELLLLAICLLGVRTAEIRPLLDALEFDGTSRARLLRTAQGAAALRDALTAATRPSEIAEAARGEPLEAVALAGALGAGDPAARWLGDLRHVTLEVTGRDLLAAGVPSGPRVGRGLRAALAAKLDGRAGDRRAELAIALAESAEGPR